MAYHSAEKDECAYGAGRYVLLTTVLSVIGWIFEVFVVFAQSGRFYNQGFLTLPICPIYGCSLLTAYFLLGTPQRGRGILKRAHNRATRYFLYFAFAFLIPSVAELFVGATFDRGLHVSLWSYSALPFNLWGYVSLPVSVVWAVLIFVFMRFAFVPIKNAIGKIEGSYADALSIGVLFIFLVDFCLNLAFIIYK